MGYADGFFRYAREREAIRHKKEKGHPRPWTFDPILHKYRFCNVHREDDKVTRWFDRTIRSKLHRSPDAMLATALFRWFNRIETGEAIFQQGYMETRSKGTVMGTPWDVREQYSVRGWTGLLQRAIKNYCQEGPYVTGSYIIQGKMGMDKLTGVLSYFQDFAERDWRSYAEDLLRRRSRSPASLEEVHAWLMESPGLGAFMAYEIVTDLRHTNLLNNAPDIMTWANPGPGARRGLNRIHGRPLRTRVPMDTLQAEMRDLLRLSGKASNWHINAAPWDMRTVEHTLCEFDKYERAKLGQGRPRGTYP